MEDFKRVYIEFYDDELNNILKDFNDVYFSNQRVFAKVCFTIYRIRQYFKDNYYQCKKGISYNFYSLMKLFGFDKKAVSRYKCCYQQFVIATCLDDACISPMFEPFSPGKLFEMLPLSYQMLETAIKNGILRSDMGCKEIRQVVKQLSNVKDIDNLVSEDLDKIEEKTLDQQEAELPEAFDPKKSHSYEYFKAMSKEELITCLFQCEDYIKKLTTKKAGK